MLFKPTGVFRVFRSAEDSETGLTYSAHPMTVLPLAQATGSSIRREPNM